jgi:hypothetical protein
MWNLARAVRVCSLLMGRAMRAHYMFFGWMLLACGSPSSSSSSSPAADEPLPSTPAPDGGTTPDLTPACGDYASALCPKSATAGAACPAYGLHCELGEASVPLTCNPEVYCLADCTWWAMPAEQTTGCAAGPQCPSDFASVPRGGACTLPDDVKSTCSFPEGKCRCSFGKWKCDEPPADCPVPRPLIGAPCASEGLQCNYEQECGNLHSLDCVKGHWQRGAGLVCG